MTRLLLIRHGFAEDWRPGLPDMERALTEEGWAGARAAMKGLVRRGLAPRRGISSPFRRAMETMACLKEASPEAFPVGIWDGLTPESDTGEAEAWLRTLLRGAGEDEILAFTSHQPFLGALLLRLVREHLSFRQASCAVVIWDGAGFALERHYLPEELAAEA